MAKIFGGRKEGYEGKEGLPKGEGGGGESVTMGTAGRGGREEIGGRAAI